ncbi:hypothetical protein B0H14DRAFT_2564293 [Mycena olivaceomarginata]|nr:hypothetical protein B0H14DRAFT_2564293 [Mycena olivaceomarginata]
MWDGLSAEEKSDWDSQAEDETGDIELNQKEFSTNIHLALKSLCQGRLIGDAEMILFYGFRNVKNGDLLAGSVHGHSKHNKTHFGGNDLESSYGIPWAQFVDSVLHFDVNGVVNFPPVDVENIPVAELRVLLEDYLKKCWGNMCLFKC